MRTLSPQGDAVRVEALKQPGIWYKTADPALNDLARLAARTCDCSVGAVVVLEGGRRVYAGAFGTSFSQPADVIEKSDVATPCSTTMALPNDGGDAIYEIANANLDAAYAETGIAIGGHIYCFYAGTPLTGPDGTALGTLFVADVEPRRLNAMQRDALAIMGRQAVTRLVAHGLGFGADVTESIRAEAELRALVRQSNSILESVGDGIYGLDLEGRVTVVNAAAAQMLGYTQEEMLGRDMHELIHHTRADGRPYPSHECAINQSLKKLETVRVSTEVFWRKDGSSFPVEYVARPQIDVDRLGTSDGEDTAGKAVGVVVAFMDTTERRALDRMKDEFVSMVSHELRTPLTSLRAALGLIKSGTLSARPEKTEQMLEIAIGNTDRLVKVVNGILDLERIRSGKGELHYTTCSVSDLLEAAVAMRAMDASQAKIEFKVEADDVKVWADPDRIIQAVTNLISNAIKFSPEGGRVVLKATHMDRDEAQIEVRDSGQGIPEDKLEQIFDRFQQVDSSDSKSMGGTGLGLSICRAIVLQHSGRIWATSRPGEGSSFFLTLPVRARGHLG